MQREGTINYQGHSAEKKTEKSLKYFWSGFIIYTVAFTLSTTTFVNYIVCNSAQICALILIICSSIKLIHSNIEDRYLKIVFPIFCGWQIFTIVRGFSFDYDFVKLMLFDGQQGALLYFTPLIMLFRNPLASYKMIFQSIMILALIYLIFDLIFLKVLLDSDGSNDLSKYLCEYFSKSLSIPVGFILLTYVYQSKRKVFFAGIVMATTIFLAIIRARRALIFMGVTITTLYLIIVLCISRYKLILIIICSLIIAAGSIYGKTLFQENKKGFFNLLSERGNEDSRSNVEESFYQDFNEEDWLIGRGIQGSYYAPQIDEEGASLNGNRFMIETDYLNIILKGGIVSLGFLLFIAVPAVLKGLFFSRNILSKVAALWILLWAIFLYPATVTTFTMSYLLVWVSIGVCYSKTLRNLHESKLHLYFST